MAGYLVRRLLWALILLLAVTLVTFVIFRVIPANAARAVAGQTATPERVAEVEEWLGVDDPVWRQYGLFLKRLIVDRSLGYSFVDREEVNAKILRAAPVTASLVFGGIALILLLAIPVGVVSALRPRSLVDRAAMVYVLIGISLPSFWLGLLLSYVVGFKLRLAPIAGYCEAFNPPEAAQCGGLVDWAHHMLLPWTTLALVAAGLFVRFVRADVMEQLHMDYVRTARGKGASEARVMRAHVLRNAMLPVVTMLGMDIGALLGGGVFVETVFGLPGLGVIAIEGIFRLDVAVTQGVVLFGAIAIIVFNFLADILYAWIDPRIRIV